MKVPFTPEACADYRFWVETDHAMLLKINALIDNARRTPFAGLGKPEPLKGEFSGWWSRRIDREHRLVDRVEGRAEAQMIVVASCRFHYGRD